VTDLRVRDAAIAYGDSRVLTNVSLDVAPGQIVTLLGANGAGKSTLLRAIAGFLPLAAGTVSLGGQRIDGLPAHEIVGRGLSLVPETRQLFATLTALENLRLGAHTHGRPRAWRDRLDEVLDAFPEIRATLGTIAGRLSSGEQQLLALGRALMARPSVLCLDDPFLGLSGRACEGLDTALRRLVAGGVAILAAGQHVRRLMALCDHAYILAEGTVARRGIPEQLDDAVLTRALIL
jgi:branched-chain amino acid transport system ATP-binding protein